MMTGTQVTVGSVCGTTETGSYTQMEIIKLARYPKASTFVLKILKFHHWDNQYPHSKLLEKGVPKGFFGCTHKRTLFGSKYGNKRALPRTKKGFFKWFSYGDSRINILGSRYHPFILRVYTTLSVQY